MSAEDLLLQSKNITNLNTENEIPRPSQADDISGSTNNSTRCPFYPQTCQHELGHLRSDRFHKNDTSLFRKKN